MALAHPTAPRGKRFGEGVMQQLWGEATLGGFALQVNLTPWLDSLPAPAVSTVLSQLPCVCYLREVVCAFGKALNTVLKSD